MNRKQRNNRRAIMLVDGERWCLQFSEGANYRKHARARIRAKRAEFIRSIKSGRGLWRYKARRKLQPERKEAQKCWRRYADYMKGLGDRANARPF